MPLVSVAVPVPHLGPLTYSLPGDGPCPAPGVRVRVPLGPRQVVGCVLGPAAEVADPRAVKPITDVLDRTSLVPPEVLDLCRWVSEYYIAGIGDAVALAMPPRTPGRATGFRVERVACITPVGVQARAAVSAASGGVEIGRAHV